MRIALVFTVAALALVLAPGAAAAPPLNDAFEAAEEVASVPFNASVDLTEATTQPGEPQFCSFKSRTAWYRFQPATTMPVQIGLAGSSPGVNLAVYRSFGSIFNLSFEGCVFGGTMTLNAQAGGVYYVQIGTDSFGGSAGQLTIEPFPPPANDDLADARTVGALPYSDVVSMLGSTLEPGEPNSGGAVGTAWWSVTAAEDGPLLVGETGACCANRIVNVYTGTGIGALDPVAVARSSGRAIFQATAGATYLVQLGHNGLFGGGDIGISVSVAPTPSVSVFYNPFDPSSFDTLGFFGNAFDPAGFPIESWSWAFGDGGTAEGQSASHRYLADGDYEATLTIVTSDGRTASSTQTVTVRTHDVAVTKLVVPRKGTAGKSATIKVTVLGARYDETVSVQLYRSTPSGFAAFATSSQFVAAGRRGTEFVFSYTFTADDAALGKVTFKAAAIIVGGRDALPSDNELVAPPTIVG